MPSNEIKVAKIAGNSFKNIMVEEKGKKIIVKGYMPDHFPTMHVTIVFCKNALKIKDDKKVKQ